MIGGASASAVKLGVPTMHPIGMVRVAERSESRRCT